MNLKDSETTVKRIFIMCLGNVIGPESSNMEGWFNG
jgi:hypothetical protein